MKPYSRILVTLLVMGMFIVGWKQTGNDNQPETMELVPMMRVLLSDIYTINEGIHNEDYNLIEQGGISIADHPVMTEKDKKLIKNTLNQEFKKFVNYDMVVHHHADSLAQAAVNRDMQEILRHYRIVQQGCVDCHTNYRSQIIEARKESG